MNPVTLNMLHSLKPFQCPSCKSSYSSKGLYKETSRFQIVRFPRILTCSHSVCENCLQTGVKKGTFSCPTCKETIDLRDDFDGISKLHPDVHALGIISANVKDSLPSIKSRYGSNNSLRRNLSQEFAKKLVTPHQCGHCHKNDALWQCDECQLNFCSICYGDVHNKIKSKKHEAKKIFAELYNSMVQEGCPQHENKTVEFYCEVDNQLTCSYCMLMGDHVGHEVKTLLDKNKSSADDLINVLEDVTKMQKRLQYTDHLLCQDIPNEKIDTSHLIEEVHNYFHKLHGLLQIRESELINELSEVSRGNARFLEDMRLKVTGFERDLASAKKDAESVIENPCLAISAPALLKKLENCKNLPCYLVPLDKSETNSKYTNVDLDLSPHLEEEIKQMGKVTCNLRARYTLMAENELPETFSPPEIPENFCVKSQGCQKPKDFDTESISTMDNFSEDSLSVSSSFSSFQATLKCKDFTKLQPEKVNVTHIKSPSCFFVQKITDGRKIHYLSEAVNKYCKHGDGKRSRATELIPGDLYLVRYSVDNRWYRGRIKTVIDPSMSGDNVILGKKVPLITDSGRVVVKDKELKAVVFYIDFGNVATVSHEDIKNITHRFLNAPSLAKECCLYDIKPKDNIWSKECNQTFAKLIENKALIMQVYEERNNVLFVDLCQAADCDITNDAPVSVRDALVFMELALFPSGVNPASKRQRKNLSKFMPPESLRVNANISAIVSHVEDPYSFYIQQMSTASYLSSLVFEMSEVYNKETNTMLHSVYVPYKGMICAAQFSVDKQWYRAEVLGLPGGANVEVQYVDFGNKEIIHHKSLRKLLDKFLKLNIQAIPCRLADVSYNQEKCWSQEAKEWLTNEVSRKQMTVKSIGTTPGSNKSEIVLYYSDEAYDICINALIVEMGLATATGPFGSADAKVKKEIPPSKENNSPADSKPHVPKVMCSPSTSIDTVISITPTKSLSPVNNHIASPVKKDMSPNKKYPSLAAPAMEPDSHVVEVHVSFVESPGCFYIRTAGNNEKNLILLMEELQKTYENVESKMIDVSVGKAYAVYSRVKNKWFRGEVLSKISEDKVKVRFVDYGYCEEVQRKDIHKLMDKFIKDENFSIRCHLDGIIPAGGSSQWSQSSCDSLRRIVEENDLLLLSYKGEPDENNSLPSDLLIEHLVKGGALEPSKLEYISITEQIVKHGFALPLRKKSGAPSGFKIQENSVKKVEETKTEIETHETETQQSSENKDKAIVINESVEEIKLTPASTQEAKPEEAVLIPKLKTPEPAVPNFQWLPAVPPLETVFKALVTNVTEEGVIQLYQLNTDSSQVDTIKKALQFKFSRSLYNEPLKALPVVGEACLAKFSVDDLWYRAEVIQHYPGKVKVNFVDYGNNEIVDLADIRLDIIMQPFPRQCLECVLYGLEDKVKWDNDLTTFIHNQLVDTEVTIELKGSSVNGKLPCIIMMKSGINIADLLLSMGFNEISEDIKSASQTDLNLLENFTAPVELREGYVFPVCITQVSAPNIICLQKLPIADPKDDYEREHNEQHEAFLQMITNLREKAETFPIVQDPMPGMVCCAKYSYDENWYRCEITNLDPNNSAVVLYVDYGNTETVPNTDLRVIENSFVNFPIQVYVCKIHGIKPTGGDWDPRINEKMVEMLVNREETLFAKVVKPGTESEEQIPQVDILVQCENSEYKLAYEELLVDGLISLEK